MVRLTNALGAEKILPETIIFRDVPLDLNIPIAPLVGLDGGVRVGKTTILPRQFELKGRIYYPDRAVIRQVFDALLSFLMQPPIEVYRLKTLDRYLVAYPQGAPHSWIDLGKELELSIPMLALDPYWYGQEVTVTVSGTQTVTVDGTAPAISLITTAGSVTSLTVANASNGRGIVVSGATGVITVDNVNYELLVGDTKRLDLVNDEWLLHGFELLPGANQITTNTPIILVYRPRWY